MNEAAVEPAPGPRTVTIQRRSAIIGTVATALVIVALAVALILSEGNSEGRPAFGGPGGPGFSGMPEQAQGMPAPPSGSGIPPMPQGVTPSTPAVPTPNSGGTGSDK
jgi:hypothetical protein